MEWGRGWSLCFGFQCQGGFDAQGPAHCGRGLLQVYFKKKKRKETKQGGYEFILES